MVKPSFIVLLGVLQLLYLTFGQNQTEESNLISYDNETNSTTNLPEDHDQTWTTDNGANTTTTTPGNGTDTDDDQDKFTSTSNAIVFEHIDFVTLRLRHVLKRTTSNLTELRIIQKREFRSNPTYESMWNSTQAFFNSTKRSELHKVYGNSSIILNAPEEYHIAIMAYTSNLYYDFNTKTRELCSGNDIDKYRYLSLFKYLELAIETLGPEIRRLQEIASSKNKTNASNTTFDSSSILYRGVGLSFALKRGQLLAFQHFISTSKALSVATGFSWGVNNTVFEFRVDNAYLGVAVGSHSYYPGENEVLLSPLQVFQVVDLDTDIGKGYKRYVLKALPLPEDPDKCEGRVEWLRDRVGYARWLKVAVAVMGALLGTIVIALIAFSLYVLLVGRKKYVFCYKRRTDSELQLT